MANLFRCFTDTSKLKTYAVYCDIYGGTWTGASLSSSDWVSLGNDNYTSTWTYYFPKNIDLSKVQSIDASIIEKTHGIRFGRGYSSNSNTAQYYYNTIVSVHGDKLVGTDGEAGGITNNSSYLTIKLVKDHYMNSSTSNNTSTFAVDVYENKIVFSFIRGDHNWGGLKVTNPEFYFNIAYFD